MRYRALVPSIIVLAALDVVVAEGRCCAVTEVKETPVSMFKDGKPTPCCGVKC
jgi:hypothetical protein